MRLFLALLTESRDPETILRRMNEAGVLGRFIPEFGRIVALMQFNMYHHYTVDEHLIRAVGILAEIERGAFSGEHPLVDQDLPDADQPPRALCRGPAARRRQGPPGTSLDRRRAHRAGACARASA